MKKNMFVPEIIRAGFRNRSDTFTGKLAYVIYLDEKGVLRKEKSWNNWRQIDLGSEDFENKPTKGFFVNRSAGGYKKGWSYRKSYIRIYDPRGFEFEITVENLMYIMEHVSTSPENGLEGEFVYGWDKADLVLIPTNSEDYKEIEKYNEILHNKDNKLRVRDLTVGGTYKDKNNRDYVYVGRRDIWESNPNWRSNSNEDDGSRTLHKGKYHTFIKRYIDRKGENFFNVITVKSPSGRFIKEVSGDKSKDFDVIMSYVNEHYKFNGVDEDATETLRFSVEELEKHMSNRIAVFIDGKWYSTSESYLPEEEGLFTIYRKVFNSRVPKYSHNRSQYVTLDKGTAEELNDRHEIYYKKHYLTNGVELMY